VIAAVGGARPPGPGLWQVSLGTRASLLRSGGYDPFSTNDVLSQFSAMALRAFVTGPGLATAAGLLWEAGNAQAFARGADARLSLSRVAVVVEERFAPRPWVYALVRVAPAWLRGSASLDDPASPASLQTSFSTFGLDAAAGLAGRLNPRAQLLGLWLMADAGYGWAQAQKMTLAPALPAADRQKAGVTELGDLAPRGAFLRFAVALEY
jgi:hypothetical protein